METEKLFMCDCHIHALEASWDVERQILDISFWQQSQHANVWDWKTRWKTIWRLLRGLPPHGDMVVFHREQTEKLLQFLHANLAAIEEAGDTGRSTLGISRDPSRRYRCTTPPNVFGISQVFALHPQLAGVYRQLAHSLLWEGKTEEFPQWAREMVATFVSMRNGCEFCTKSHRAVALSLTSPSFAKQWLEGMVIDPREIRGSWRSLAPAHSKYHTEDEKRWSAVLDLAETFRLRPRGVGYPEVRELGLMGFSERSVQEVGLIVSAFCMFNRMVEGFGTECPPDADYQRVGNVLATYGYSRKESRKV